MNILRRGFTIIELLMVIAIIGILASVVLGQVNKARLKAADTGIKQTIANMRSQAELYFDTNHNYNGLCDNQNIQMALSKAETFSAGGATKCVDGDDVTGVWAMEAQLLASTTQYYCVDSTGASVTVIGSTLDAAGGDAVCE